MRRTVLLIALVGVLAGMGCPVGGDDGNREPAWLLPCDNPAPCDTPGGAYAGHMVYVHDGLDVAAEAARNGSECTVPVEDVGSHWFTTPKLDYLDLACLRCDPAVEAIYVSAILFPM